MIQLLKEVDFRQTRNNARNVLKSFRRLERIAGRSLIDIRTPIITDMPKGTSYGNKAEEAIVQMMNVEAERDAILTALMSLSIISRQILHYSFCVQDHYSNYKIAGEIGYSERSIQRMKPEALIEFAEAYRNGVLIVYRN
ncbi:ArpU family phage packaging/lysis transcriptional regulator [Enterococcus faecalis]|uniref:ArpU family phage packaging/lysis transcriptional regulator n=1 Tax=Enterococcus TaxID=1350 RepID=UPI000F8049E5|nr:ArpU family phage packaging/lysis transcriptional regulator [Enterococcus faecalis]EGO6570120.1 autolysin [Enterococcus faecalis]EGO7756673.1 autolysin [Enterococcus faecalis]EGO8279967.1 autolysin [Enterococcus faecalis]EGO8520000.1 autolysin [Enterococcus faecalis]EHK9404542.1 autolysin [Enterococcus faecalis]